MGFLRPIECCPRPDFFHLSTSLKEIYDGTLRKVFQTNRGKKMSMRASLISFFSDER